MVYGWGRFCDIKGCMLWTRTFQWAWALHTTVESMPEEEPLCLLGPIPSFRESKQVYCRANYDRVEPVHESDELELHSCNGLMGLDCLGFSILWCVHVSLCFSKFCANVFDG